jgi:cell division septum initiation protein DivIVA
MTIAKLNTSIAFEKQLNGYSKEQVDRYITDLATAYQSAYDEYNNVCAQHNALLDDYKLLQAKIEERPNTGFIAKTLADTEIIVQKIIADAHAEAAIITAEAKAGAQRIIDEAYTEKAMAKILVQKTIDDANTEAVRVKVEAQRALESAKAEVSIAQEQAKKMIEDARMEASQIKYRVEKDREQSNEILRMTISKIQAAIIPATASDTSGEDHYSSIQAIRECL